MLSTGIPGKHAEKQPSTVWQKNLLREAGRVNLGKKEKKKSSMHTQD